MRAAIAAAFAAGAMAVPYVKPRQNVDWVTDVEVEYATVIVTVTAGGEAPASTASRKYGKGHYGHNNWHPFSGWNQYTRSSSSSAPAATSEAPAPTSEAPTSEAPAPTTTSTSVAEPAPTSEASTSEAPAPTTYQQPASSSAAAPSSAYSAPSSAGTSYSDIAVYHHNIHRANHSAPDVQWSDALAATAEKIASSCVYAHDTTTDKDSIGGYGQNIAAGVKADNISAIITDLFYNGEVGWYDGLYGEAQPDMTNFEHWGHFSQIVWKDTTHIGCATYDCTDKGLANVSGAVSPFFTVCNYQNPGNYANEYADNVGVSLNRATAAWNAGM